MEQVHWGLLNRHTQRMLQTVGQHGKITPVFLIIDDCATIVQLVVEPLISAKKRNF